MEITNKDLQIASFTDDSSELDMEITVSQGRGYLTTEERKKEDLEIGTMLLDALFSPVKNVGFRREDIRVGEITNYDKLTLNIETDGTITPKEAVKQASQILIDHLNLLVGGKEEMKEDVKEKKVKKELSSASTSAKATADRKAMDDKEKDEKEEPKAEIKESSLATSFAKASDVKKALDVKKATDDEEKAEEEEKKEKKEKKKAAKKEKKAAKKSKKEEK